MSVNKNQPEVGEEKIIPVLPHMFGRNAAIPADLIGATIVAFGTTDIRKGGLEIEYRPCGSTETVRLEIGFDETGMWI